MVDVVAHVHCHLGIYTSADMTSNCPLFNTLCLIHSQKKELPESFLSKKILELKCCLGSGIFNAAVKRGVAPPTSTKGSGSNFKITLRLLYGL